MTCLNEILGKGTTWMRACGITSHFLFHMTQSLFIFHSCRGTALTGFHVKRFAGGSCRRPNSTARGAASLYVGGVYRANNDQAESSFGRLYENKKEAETHASMVSASFLFSTDAAPVAYSLLSLVHSLLSLVL